MVFIGLERQVELVKISRGFRESNQIHLDFNDREAVLLLYTLCYNKILLISHSELLEEHKYTQFNTFCYKF